MEVNPQNHVSLKVSLKMTKVKQSFTNFHMTTNTIFNRNLDNKNHCENFQLVLEQYNILYMTVFSTSEDVLYDRVANRCLCSRKIPWLALVNYFVTVHRCENIWLPMNSKGFKTEHISKETLKEC